MLLQERGWQAIQSVLQNPDVDPILAGPALTEIVTVARRKGNQSTGKQIWGMLGALGVKRSNAVFRTQNAESGGQTTI